ncbi:hypothetical protein Hypma_006513 [Hypsizygus marmoreus]|uniref:Uncharacterized protein n=1 Tax=Hypsizygus marmoreus TaxID=39966 RepID=A0A369JYH5_HYPMA|nr:hypothetical protein Hypma_006513 [Hypsizygus marmoreus]
MPVTEADTAVLQPLTNGHHVSALATKDEVNGASSTYEVIQDLKGDFKENLASEPVTKTAEAVSHPLSSELDTILAVKPSADLALSQGDTITGAYLNGGTDAHATTGSLPILTPTEVNSQPIVSLGEEQGASTENPIHGTEEGPAANVLGANAMEPQSIASAPLDIDRVHTEEKPVEIVERLSSESAALVPEAAEINEEAAGSQPTPEKALGVDNVAISAEEKPAQIQENSTASVSGDTPADTAPDASIGVTPTIVNLPSGEASVAEAKTVDLVSCEAASAEPAIVAAVAEAEILAKETALSAEASVPEEAPAVVAELIQVPIPTVVEETVKPTVVSVPTADVIKEAQAVASVETSTVDATSAELVHDHRQPKEVQPEVPNPIENVSSIESEVAPAVESTSKDDEDIVEEVVEPEIAAVIEELEKQDAADTAVAEDDPAQIVEAEGITEVADIQAATEGDDAKIDEKEVPVEVEVAAIEDSEKDSPPIVQEEVALAAVADPVEVKEPTALVEDVATGVEVPAVIEITETAVEEAPPIVEAPVAVVNQPENSIEEVAPIAEVTPVTESIENIITPAVVQEEAIPIIEATVAEIKESEASTETVAPVSGAAPVIESTPKHTTAVVDAPKVEAEDVVVEPKTSVEGVAPVASVIENIGEDSAPIVQEAAASNVEADVAEGTEPETLIEEAVPIVEVAKVPETVLEESAQPIPRAIEQVEAVPEAIADEVAAAIENDEKESTPVVQEEIAPPVEADTAEVEEPETSIGDTAPLVEGKVETESAPVTVQEDINPSVEPSTAPEATVGPEAGLSEDQQELAAVNESTEQDSAISLEPELAALIKELDAPGEAAPAIIQEETVVPADSIVAETEPVFGETKVIELETPVEAPQPAAATQQDGQDSEVLVAVEDDEPTAIEATQSLIQPEVAESEDPVASTVVAKEGIVPMDSETPVAVQDSEIPAVEVPSTPSGQIDSEVAAVSEDLEKVAEVSEEAVAIEAVVSSEAPIPTSSPEEVAVIAADTEIVAVEEPVGSVSSALAADAPFVAVPVPAETSSSATIPEDFSDVPAEVSTTTQEPSVEQHEGSAPHESAATQGEAPTADEQASVIVKEPLMPTAPVTEDVVVPTNEIIPSTVTSTEVVVEAVPIKAEQAVTEATPAPDDTPVSKPLSSTTEATSVLVELDPVQQATEPAVRLLDEPIQSVQAAPIQEVVDLVPTVVSGDSVTAAAEPAESAIAQSNEVDDDNVEAKESVEDKPVETTSAEDVEATPEQDANVPVETKIVGEEPVLLKDTFVEETDVTDPHATVLAEETPVTVDTEVHLANEFVVVEDAPAVETPAEAVILIAEATTLEEPMQPTAQPLEAERAAETVQPGDDALPVEAVVSPAQAQEQVPLDTLVEPLEENVPVAERTLTVEQEPLTAPSIPAETSSVVQSEKPILEVSCAEVPLVTEVPAATETIANADLVVEDEVKSPETVDAIPAPADVLGEKIEELPGVEAPVTIEVQEQEVQVKATIEAGEETVDIIESVPEEKTSVTSVADGPEESSIAVETPPTTSDETNPVTERETSLERQAVSVSADATAASTAPESDEQATALEDTVKEAEVPVNDADGSESIFVTESTPADVEDTPASIDGEEIKPVEIDPHSISYAVTHTGLAAIEVQGTEDAPEETVLASVQAEVPDITPAASLEEPSTGEETEQAEVTEVFEVVADISDKIVEEPPSESTKRRAQSTAEETLAVQAEVERPKSPWTSSFQVTTVGRGVSPSPDDQPLESQEVSESVVDAREATSHKHDPATTIAPEVPVVVTPVADDVLDIVNEVVTPQLLVDTTSLDNSPEPTRPWTPSYSVHSQGSPLLANVDLVEETAAPPARPWTPSYSVHSQGSPSPSHIQLDEEAAVGEQQLVEAEVQEPELDEMEFAKNDELTNPVPASETESSVLAIDQAIDVVQEIPNNDAIDIAPVTDEIVVTEAPIAAEVSQKEEAVVVPRLILNTNEVEDVQEPSADDVDASSSHLSPRPGDGEGRPASSTWVSSYSVSIQGSPSQERSNPLDEQVEEDDQSLAVIAGEVTTVQLPKALLVDEAPVPVQEVVPAVIAETTGYPTIAVSVDNEVVQTEPPAAAPAPSIVSAPNEIVAEISRTFIVTVDDGENDVKVMKEDQSDDPVPLTPSGHSLEMDRPKSPWTPSYSVTTQGPGTVADEEELDKLEPLDSTQEATIAESTVVLIEVTSVAAEIPEAATPTEPDAAAIAAFPTVEIEELQESKKPVIARLAPVDEIGVSEVTPTSTDTLSPTTRQRLESTASSRFFPGGWFSPSAQGRTSLEIAQGEFTHVKLTVPVETGDVSDTPPELEEDAASIASDDTADSGEEERRRWCVVM